MLHFYDVLEQETQSHANCVTCLLTEKSTGETKFCKTIIKQDDMPLKRIQKTCQFMGGINHNILLKVQEVFISDDKIFLVYPSLRATHKPLSELDTVLDESQITRIVEKLIQLCLYLHRKGITAANIHPGNVFIDEDDSDDVLVTDIGFAYMPNMDPVTKF